MVTIVVVVVVVRTATGDRLQALFTVVPTSAQLKIGPWVRVLSVIPFLPPTRNGL